VGSTRRSAYEAILENHMYKRSDRAVVCRSLGRWDLKAKVSKKHFSYRKCAKCCTKAVPSLRCRKSVIRQDVRCERASLCYVKENREYFLLLDTATKPHCQHGQRCRIKYRARLTAVYILRAWTMAVVARRLTRGESALPCFNSKILL
jgi:hypothetical protein